MHGTYIVSENNILLALYDDTCAHDAHHSMFVSAHYQTGPGVLHLAAMNKNVYPQIMSDWNLPNNCTTFVWLNFGTAYEDASKRHILPNHG